MKKKYAYYDLTRLAVPVGSLKANAAGAVVSGAASGTDADENVFMFPELPSIEQHNIATNTLIGPQKTATGMIWSCDQADNDGVELCPGGILSSSPLAFTVGTDPAFFIKAVFGWVAADDEQDFDLCCVGFRRAGNAYYKLQAQADLTTATSGYTDFAYLNCDQGDVYVEQCINSAAVTSTDTTVNLTQAGNTNVTFEVRVSAAGVITYYVNGTQRTEATQTFDSGDIVIPSLIFVHDAADGDVELRSLEIGYQN